MEQENLGLDRSTKRPMRLAVKEITRGAVAFYIKVIP